MEKVKKILMIVQSIYPNDSRVRREAEAISDANTEVHIICLRKVDQSKFEKIDNIYIYRIKKLKDDENILDYILHSLSFLTKALISSFKLSMKNYFDLIQVHNLPDYLVFAALPFKIKKKPIILDLHDLTPELFKSKWRGKHKIILGTTKIVEKISCGIANHIITTSHGFKNTLIKRGIPATKITIILNNPSKFVNRTRPIKFKDIRRNLKLVYHGTIAYRFGLHLVIEAMPQIIKEIPDSTFDIYGGGDSEYKEYLFRLIKSKNLEKNVSIHNSLIHEEIIEKVQNFDIGVVPYLEDEFMQLALSTKAFEYAKLYIPIVSSDLNPMREFFDDNCVAFFKPGDINDLAKKIISISFSGQRLENLAMNAFNKVKFIIDGSIETKYKMLINELIEKNNERYKS